LLKPVPLKLIVPLSRSAVPVAAFNTEISDISGSVPMAAVPRFRI
jgi:hypothetical protein